MTLVDLLRDRLGGASDAIASLEAHLDAVAAACSLMHERLDRGGTLYTCGNGGSAAEALHLTEELIGRYRADRAPRAAICLNADPTALTCIANDFGFDEIFARQVTALAGPDDVLVVLSTSGHSPNVFRALHAARERGCSTIALLGKDGGPAKAVADLPIVVDSDDSAHVQEAHLVIVHMICESFELDQKSKSRKVEKSK